MSCPECEIGIVRGVEPIRRGAFVLHPRSEDAAVPGWWIVSPVRHVEQVDQLTADELAALGPAIAEVAAALRASTSCEKIYVNVFAEILPHFHVHVIARPAGLPDSARGPAIFRAPPFADSRSTDAVAARVAARLSGTAQKRSS